MKTTPVREINRGPVVNWLTDRLLDALSFLSGKLYPYALMYEVEFDDDEEDEFSGLQKNKLENTEATLWTHPPQECLGEVCTIHNRSDHIMRGFPQSWRIDRGIIERTCAHGVGHPDPDEYRIINGTDDGVHGCDGCCGKDVKTKTRKRAK
jgi:hypothetical protein